MHRTPTKNLSHFTLPPPSSASITFDDAASKVHIRIASSSTFTSPQQWHTPPLGPHRLLCTEGSIQVSYSPNALTSGTDILSDKSTHVFYPGGHTSWARALEYKGSVTVTLETQSQDMYRLRNIYSAFLDAEKVPFLDTSPAWLRILYQALRVLPGAQTLLIRALLFIQLQVIAEKHHFHQYQGGIDTVRLWFLLHPLSLETAPDWVQVVRWSSVERWSKAVQVAGAWVGRKVLGMKGLYDEYVS